MEPLKSIAKQWADVLPRLVIAPSFLITLIFVYGFIAWTAVISFTPSNMVPRFEFAGFEQYVRLWANLRWHTAVMNVFVFGGLFISLCLAIGLFLAVLLDQKIRAEGFFRNIYLYPMALSFIVTGTAWKWILNPEHGLEKMVREWGYSEFVFDWLVNPEMAIYTVVIAGIWQSSGFVMALFLAALRGVDQNLFQAARIDGASLPRTYLRVILPTLKPVFLSAIVILSHGAVKGFDLVVALTGGGPGYATDLPATFMYAHAFLRSQLGLATASAMMLLLMTMAILVPYLYGESRSRGRNE